MGFHSQGRFSFYRALLASLLAHFLLLWPAVPVAPEMRSVAPLRVTLAAGATQAGRAADPAALALTRKIVRVPKVVKPMAPEVVPATSVAASSVGSAEAEELRGYRLALARGAAAFRRYPESALAAGWHGTVEVQVDVTAAGAVRSYLLGSSGREPLDQSALDMARQTLAVTPLPPPLRGKVFSLTLPFIFDLAE